MRQLICPLKIFRKKKKQENFNKRTTTMHSQSKGSLQTQQSKKRGYVNNARRKGNNVHCPSSGMHTSDWSEGVCNAPTFPAVPFSGPRSNALRLPQHRIAQGSRLSQGSTAVKSAPYTTSMQHHTLGYRQCHKTWKTIHTKQRSWAKKE